VKTETVEEADPYLAELEEFAAARDPGAIGRAT